MNSESIPPASTGTGFEIETTPDPLPGRIATGRSARILLVDDDQMIREVVSRYLRQFGFAVSSCENGSQALRSLDQEPADLVITDLFMPDSDGIELICSLRRREPRLKAIVISGGEGYRSASRDAARLLGAHTVISKPFALSDLMATARAILEPAVDR